MTVHHKLTITGPGAAAPHGPHRGVAPTSNPPGYNFQFGGSPGRMHEKGHIWFNPDPQGVTISIEIDLASNFVFANNGTPDGTLALFISDDPANKVQFNGFGVFTAPTLDTTTFKKLVFSSNGGGKVYYYQLNVIDLVNNVVVAWDPIIINQP